MESKKNNSSTVGGVVLVGCMFIGIGLGMLYHQTAIGVMIGLGVGFIGMGLVWAIMREKDSSGKN